MNEKLSDSYALVKGILSPLCTLHKQMVVSICEQYFNMHLECRSALRVWLRTYVLSSVSLFIFVVPASDDVQLPHFLAAS